ncbi:MAG: N,N-dimethylformamidase large subunit [Rhodospirillales bacterium]|nr:N,N-dimethylformamidase large subunit [Rhodospirillales bacterium]
MFQNTIALIGYADRWSARPGDTISFKVSSRSDEPYRARLVRVISGDPNPAGPGIKEVPVAADFEGSWPSRAQDAELGSYARIQGASLKAEALTVSATVWPTLPGRRAQGIVSWLGNAGGLALLLDGERGASVRVATARGPETVAVGKPLRSRAWYKVWASVDPRSGAVHVGQQALDPLAVVDDTGTASASLDAPSPAGDGELLIGALGGAPVGGHFNGKIEWPTIVRGASQSDDPLSDGAPSSAEVIANWDFSLEISSLRVVDVGPNGWDGELVNLPARAMKGSNWSGREQCWRHAPAEYGAIHFHEDDLHDCGWETDFSFTVPADLRSGAYAVRLRCREHEDMIPFFVLPPRGARRTPLCVLIPTFTYTVYGNYARGVTNDEYQTRARAWGAREATPDDHREYGLSTYNFHTDDSGIGFASQLRPVLNLRSAFLGYVDAAGSGLRHFPADTHLLDWLDEKGYEFDVVTDDDLHREGHDLIAPYRVVLTPSHPEYHTANTLDALRRHLDEGGRLMYLGGNGFYWRVALSDAVPGAIEIRRGEGGIRAWAAEPGEYYNAFDGEYGGLWRRNDRPPQRMVGVGFSGQGHFVGSYYVRAPGADDPRAAWIFEGVPDRILGDFGLSGGGAAGFELDRVDFCLGSPPNTIILATSERHGDTFMVVPEELLTHLATWPGEPPDALIRSDMVFFETGRGGAVFSVGSITYCGSLSHNGYDNNISRVTKNVLDRFLDPAPFET